LLETIIIIFYFRAFRFFSSIMKTSIFLIIILALMAIISSIEKIKASVGIDFYQFWAVSKAQEWSNYNLKSPYFKEAQYAGVINSYADSSNDSQLKRVNRVFKKLPQFNLDPTGTPLFYWIFAKFPQNYSLSFYTFQALRVILFIISVVLLNSGSHGNRLGLVSLGLLLSIVYGPFLSDLRVGNINSFQMFIFVILLTFADRVLSTSARHVLLFSVVFLCALVFMALLKPNLILVILLLSIYLWALNGTKILVKAGIASLFFGAILLLLPCIYFESWQVWSAWYDYVLGNDKILYPVYQGNFSTVLLTSQIFGISIFSTWLIIATILIILGSISIMIAISFNKSKLKGLWEIVVEMAQDPFLCAAIGITATLALMPLVWYHYFIMSLIPAIWMLTASNRSNLIAGLGGLSMILTSELPGNLIINLFGWSSLLPYIIAMGWVPLWAGILGTIVWKKRGVRNEVV